MIGCPVSLIVGKTRGRLVSLRRTLTICQVSKSSIVFAAILSKERDSVYKLGSAPVA